MATTWATSRVPWRGGVAIERSGGFVLRSVVALVLTPDATVQLSHGQAHWADNTISGEATMPLFRRKEDTRPRLVDLREGGTVEVVGESHYQEALEKICGGKTEDGHRRRVAAALVPESDNPHDENAIAVYIESSQIGYLSREDASRYRMLAEEMAQRGEIGQVSALIAGGWRRSREDQGSFGVTLFLAEPESAHPNSPPPRARPRTGSEAATNTGASTSPRLVVGMVDGHHYTDWVESVKHLKRSKNYTDALTLLYRLCAAAQAESEATGQTLAPWYFEQVAIEERRAGRLDREIAILDHYRRSPYAIAGQFDERLGKALGKLPPPG